MGAGMFQPLRLFGTGTTPQQVALADLDGNGSIDLVTADRTSNSVTVLLNNTSTVSVGAGRPVTDLRVGPTFPNPAPASVTIPFAMVREGSARIRIYDAEGRVVRTLVDATLGSGEHLASWDRRTEAGTRAGAGIYFYELRASGHVANGRFVLL
jgi:hypothetical protein